MVEHSGLHDSITINDDIQIGIISYADEDSYAGKHVYRGVLKPASVSVVCHFLLALIVTYSLKEIARDQPQTSIDPIKAVLWSEQAITKTQSFSDKAAGRAIDSIGVSNQVFDFDVTASARTTADKRIDAKKAANSLTIKSPDEVSLPSPSALTIKEIKQATQAYIQNLNTDAQSALPIPSVTPKRPKKVVPLSLDEQLRKSIEITANCETWSGQLFAALSKNRGVVLEDRDLSSATGEGVLPPKGSVVCNKFGDVHYFINNRVKKINSR